MHLAGSSLLLSPSDLTAYLDCEHLTQLDLSVAFGELNAPALEDPELDIVRRRGGEHESAILAAVLFNALIIIALIPLALRGVKYRPQSAGRLLARNLVVYGAGGVIVPFAGIKAIDVLMTAIGVV